MLKPTYKEEVTALEVQNSELKQRFVRFFSEYNAFYKYLIEILELIEPSWCNKCKLRRKYSLQ